MNWIILSIVSAILLGIYDAAKKWSVRDNAVPIVLLCNVSIGALLYLPLMIWSAVSAETIPWESFVVRPLSWNRHGLILSKSVLVGASWTFAFSALKHLPLSIAAPIRATSPFWTIVIAILFFGERPTTVQWAGIVIILIGFWQFTLVGRREGIRFSRNRWVSLMLIATLLGALSSIYDKWLLQYAHFEPVTMQAWFTVYLVPVMVPLALWWYRNERSTPSFASAAVTPAQEQSRIPSQSGVREEAGRFERSEAPTFNGTVESASRDLVDSAESKIKSPPNTGGTGEESSSGAGAVERVDPTEDSQRFRLRQPFQWRWSIAMVSPLLIAADWFYFVALSDPGAMVSVVSVVRRCSVVIALGFGAKALSESNFKAKSACVALILVGVVMLTWHG